MLSVQDAVSSAGADGDTHRVPGVRYQKKLDSAWIFRADAMMTARDNQVDLSGTRVTVRIKF